MTLPDVSDASRLFLSGEQTTKITILQDQNGSQCLYIGRRVKWFKEEEILSASELMEIVGEGVKCELVYCSFKTLFDGNPPADLDEANQAGLIE